MNSNHYWKNLMKFAVLSYLIVAQLLLYPVSILAQEFESPAPIVTEEIFGVSTLPSSTPSVSLTPTISLTHPPTQTTVVEPTSTPTNIIQPSTITK